jgi:hypothetical protein
MVIRGLIKRMKKINKTRHGNKSKSFKKTSKMFQNVAWTQTGQSIYTPIR